MLGLVLQRMCRASSSKKQMLHQWQLQQPWPATGASVSHSSSAAAPRGFCTSNWRGMQLQLWEHSHSFRSSYTF